MNTIKRDLLANPGELDHFEVIIALRDAAPSLFLPDEIVNVAEAFVEFCVTEARRAVDLGADIIGINNRDLTRMKTDKETTARLRPLIPRDRTVISESGIESRADIDALARLSVDAALIGESLLRAADLEAKVRELSGR